MVHVEVGAETDRDGLLRKLVAGAVPAQRRRVTRGTFRVRGDTLEVFPAYQEHAIRVEFFGDEIERLMTLHPLTGEVLTEEQEIYIGPATHYVTAPERMERAIRGIEEELERAARRARARRQAAGGAAAADAHHVRHRDDAPDRHLLRHRELLAPPRRARRRDARRTVCSTTSPRTSCWCIDESHVTVPQIGGMYEGDMSRKRTLVEHGFRLPSAMDNRPLRWEEFLDRIGQTVYLSATPGPYEHGQGPTGSSSRSSGRPGWSTPRSSSSPPRARSTT